MTTTHAVPPPPPQSPQLPELPALPTAEAKPSAPTALPSASGRTGTAPLVGNSARLVQIGMFVAGAVLLPVGIVVICLGWYGIAHTPYEYDQLVYLVSGGMLGLGITFVGGFLYFAAWIARIGTDLKESDKRLADTLLVLADSLSQAAVRASTPPSIAGSVQHNSGATGTTDTVGTVATMVVAGSSTTVHRVDCVLIEGRTDVHPASANSAGLTTCRLCGPAE